MYLLSVPERFHGMRGLGTAPWLFHVEPLVGMALQASSAWSRGCSLQIWSLDIESTLVWIDFSVIGDSVGQRLGVSVWHYYLLRLIIKAMEPLGDKGVFGSVAMTMTVLSMCSSLEISSCGCSLYKLFWYLMTL